RSYEPIQARRVHALQRGWLWARRHPARAAAAAMAVLAAFAFMALSLTWLYLGQRETILEMTTRAKEDAPQGEGTGKRLRTEGEEARRRADHYLYFNRVLLAHQEWQQNNLLRARELLELCPVELRRWEWHYLDRLCHSGVRSIRVANESGFNAAFSPD